MDWTVAALRALARGGVAALRVDVLAKELGATRGSFYWHFKDWEALLMAALELWEEHSTVEPIRTMGERITDPAQRLRATFAFALGNDRSGKDERLATEDLSGLEPALMADADHPVVAPVLCRLTERRIGFLTEVFTDAGFPATAARQRAVIAYATYVGWIELRRATPHAVPEVAGQGEAAQTLIDQLVDHLLTPG